MTALATAAELQTFLNRTFADGGETDQVELALATVTADMQRIAGQQFFEVADDDVVLDPEQADVVFLPERPVTEVSAVAISGTDLDIDAQVYWYDDGRLYRNPCGSWGYLRRSVAVTYTHGYADDAIPDDLKGVCMSRVGRWLDEGGTIPATSLVDGDGNTVATTRLSIASVGFTADELEILAGYSSIGLA